MYVGGSLWLDGTRLAVRLEFIGQTGVTRAGSFFFKGQGQPSCDQEFPAWEQNPGLAQGLDQ